MTVKLYHQVGHFGNWNFTSFEAEGCGDGLILSPVHQNREQIAALTESLRTHSLFDPQYYLPNSPKAKLASYEFFPEQIANGFSTKDFPLVALQSAELCVAFQVAREFEGIVIPARFLDQMSPKYFERQEEYTVLPFLKALSKAGIPAKPIYLTVPLTAAMLRDEDFHVQILNWVTGFPEISGIYVLVNDDRTTKQIRSREFLSAYLEFAYALSNAGLSVIAGHLNSESALFTLVDEITVTFGSFENTRIFSLDKFIESEEERRAPKARIYLPALLNWIQYDQAMQIRDDDPALWAQLYRPTQHGDGVLAAPVEPYFNQPALYKHHFVCMHEQIKTLAKESVLQRYQRLRDHIREGMGLYQRIEDMPLDLDPHGSGEHLPVWLDSLNGFYRRHLKS